MSRARSSEGEPAALVGWPMERVEDDRFLAGAGRYIADIRLPGVREVAFLRSAVGHGRLLNVKPQAAVPRSDVWSASDLAPHVRPMVARLERESFRQAGYPVLATDRVRFVGELIAAVIADTRAVAEDLVEQIDVDIEPLPAAASIEAALAEDATLLHEGWADNCYMRVKRATDGFDSVAGTADVTITRQFHLGRVTPCPLEGRGCVAWFDRRAGQLLVYVSTQRPHLIRSFLAEHLNGLDESRIRVVVPDVGGAFGGKTNLYPEELALAAIAMQVSHPVRWIEDRYEHLISACHAREHEQTITLHARRSGEIVAMEARIRVDAGAYSMITSTGAIEANMAASVLPGPYRIGAYRFEAVSVCTNKVPLGPFRGVGRPSACFGMERMIDELAHALGMDPAAVRRINMLEPQEFPYKTSSGLLYDSGNYRGMVDVATRAAGHDSFRAEQAAVPATARRRIGLGYAAYVEQTAHGAAEFIARGSTVLYGFESARVSLDQTGALTIQVGVLSLGQGIETTLTQIACDATTLTPDKVSVQFGDTQVAPYGMGSVASRSVVMAGGATFHACRKLIERIKHIGAHLMQCTLEDVTVRDGAVHAGGASMTFAKIAHVAWQHVHLLPDGIEPGLEFLANYRPDVQSGTFSSGLHAVKVAVDIDTGNVELLDYVVVEDCGRAINPKIVDGQVTGGVAQGIGQALFEQLRYDADGQPKAVTLADYVLPGFEEVPDISIEHMETLSTFTVHGMKGTGEGGAIAPAAAIANAITDALRPLGVSVSATPMTPASLWCALDRARSHRDTVFTHEVMT
jgi:aerobic carbon-monoxide dehydrogenase large subunit